MTGRHPCVLPPPRPPPAAGLFSATSPARPVQRVMTPVIATAAQRAAPWGTMSKQLLGTPSENVVSDELVEIGHVRPALELELHATHSREPQLELRV